MPPSLLRAAWLLPVLLLAGCGGGGGSSVGPQPMAPTAGAVSQTIAYNAGGAAPTTVTLSLGGGAATGVAVATQATHGTANASGTSISYTPAASYFGADSFTYTASNSAGTSNAATVSLTINSPNALAVMIDSGPLPSTNPTVNVIYASVKICTPGSTTACLTIDHIQVDTASYGLRILADERSGALPVTPPVLDPVTHNPLFECVVFADGYTWGSVVSADVQVGGRTLTSLPIHLIAAAPSGVSAPADCSSGHGNAENLVTQFGANGLLGIGPFLQDCPACVSGAVHAAYYVCPGNACAGTAVSTANQLQNPVALLASDNNGVTVQLPAVMAPGVPTLTGTVYFGVGTQADNAVGSATWLALSNSGEFTTSYATMTLSNSFMDTGSNGYFFNKASSDAVLKTCTVNTWAYCPTATTAEMATIDPNGTNRLINFSVDNADNDFSTTNDVAFPNLAGPATAANAPSSSFDWGLPFFFGRTVFVLFETKTAGTVTGPATAF